MNHEFTSDFTNKLWIHCVSFTFDSFHYEFTFNSANKLWIRKLFQNFTMTSRGIWRIHYFFCESSKNSRGVLRMLYKFSWCFAIVLRTIFFWEFTMKLLSLSRVNCKFTLFSRIHYEFTKCFAKLLLKLFSANSIWIYWLYLRFTKNSLWFTNWLSLSVLGIDCESTIYFANSLSFSRIHYLSCDSTINSLD